MSGCTDADRLNFAGESENWNVFYTVDVMDPTSEQTTGSIKYVGENDAPEDINYRINSISCGREGTMRNLEEGIASLGSGFCEGCTVVQKDSEIQVTITWNGKSEELILEN